MHFLLAAPLLSPPFGPLGFCVFVSRSFLCGARS